ncbi:MAG: YiiD C-terminal domain-containing protein [Campylobacteraceae bacterium]|nr:YiiD C-terminal domain-containing protein [Campylobacteraceae bacterium]
MLLNKLKQKIHSEIPLTAFMNIDVKNYDDSHLLTTAPLDININDKGTGFAGSLSTLTTISGWSLCWLLTQEMGFENTSIVILKSDIRFLKPVTKDIICLTQVPNKEDVLTLKNKLINKGSGSIFIKSSISENEHTCVSFEGIYVIKII